MNKRMTMQIPLRRSLTSFFKIEILAEPYFMINYLLKLQIKKSIIQSIIKLNIPLIKFITILQLPTFKKELRILSTNDQRFLKINQLRLPNMKQDPIVTLQNRFQINYAQKLGEGSSAKVYKGVDLNQNVQIAVKVISTKSLTNQVYKYLFDMQLTALKRLNHPNVIRCYRVIFNNDHCNIVTQLLNGKTLAELVQRQGPFKEKQALKIMLGILSGYQQLIKNQIQHRDLKTANVMLHNGESKIIDFGYCQIQGYEKPAKKYNVGSPNYMAPETFQSNIYDQKAEIWSIGAIFYQIVTGKTLHDGRIKMPENYANLRKFGAQLTPQISQFSKRLISQCFNFNPNERPTCKNIIQQIKQHLSSPQPLRNPNVQVQPPKNQFEAKMRKCSDHIVVHNRDGNEFSMAARIRKGSNCQKQFLPQSITYNTLQPKYLHGQAKLLQPNRNINFPPRSEYAAETIFKSKQVNCLNSYIPSVNQAGGYAPLSKQIKKQETIINDKSNNRVIQCFDQFPQKGFNFYQITSPSNSKQLSENRTGLGKEQFSGVKRFR